MYKVILDLISHGHLKFEEGEINLLKQNVIIFPFENIFLIQKLLEKPDKTYDLYLASKKLGKDWITALFKEYKLQTIEEQAKWGENVFTLAGFGKMKVVSWDVNKKTMVYRVHNSITAKYFGKTKHPVCHIPRGWFAGAASVFFKQDVDAVETSCMSLGSEYCEFLIKPKGTFNFKEKEVRRQLKIRKS